ncbi:MAG: hypothetical protein C0392_06700, partial [Syntrophus sp. (in: bacteria)]|nr:hypothetical protein [Syntrophus sp. (in: bacteria)]
GKEIKKVVSSDSSYSSGQEMKSVISTSPVPVSEDVVKNTLLLSTVLPNLLAVKPQVNMNMDDQQRQVYRNEIPVDSLSTLISVLQTGMYPEMKKGAEGSEEGATKGVFKNLFEVVQGVTKGTAPEQTQDISKTPLAASLEAKGYDEELNTALLGDKLPMTIARINPGKYVTIQSPGLQSQTEGFRFNSTEHTVEEMSLINKIGFSVSNGENESGSMFQGREEKQQEPENSADVPSVKDDINPLSREDLIKTGTRQEKEGAAIQEKGVLASVMTRKIEEMVEKFANRTQPMDMVLRLKISDNESLLVGLKEQGNRVIVEVKSASEGLMNLLQSQKDAITRELESKLIYATINVDPQGTGDFQRRGQRDQRKQNAGEKEKEAFMGVLDALG